MDDTVIAISHNLGQLPWANFAAAVVIMFAIRAAFNLAMSRWHMAAPNEWLLLLQNGELVKAGIGMSCFCPPGAQVVKFPSSMQETTFTASQATKQRAGVSVTGKAYWSIYRPSEEDPDGPFRAFKSLNGLADGDFKAGNEKVTTLAISTIRDAVSKMSIVEVMTSREELKERVKADITPIFRGWGMWLETVEILDVRVESKSLFDDMQYLRNDMLNFDTKADAHLSAEEAKMVAAKALESKKLASATEMAKQRADADAEQGVYAATQRLKREEGEAKLDESRQAMLVALESKKLATATTMAKQRADADTEQGVYAASQRLKREEGEAQLEEARQTIKLSTMAKEHELKLQALADKKIQEDLAVKQELEVARLKADQAHSLQQRKFELEATMTPVNLQKAALDATKDVYSTLPIRDVKLVALGEQGHSSGDGIDRGAAGGGLGSILPQVAAASEAWTAVSR